MYLYRTHVFNIIFAVDNVENVNIILCIVYENNIKCHYKTIAF